MTSLDETIGLVPTMGALHAGHRSLIDAARHRCAAVVVSIFVNPTQFSPGEDFDRYPKTPDSDLTVCRDAGVDLVFMPALADIYPTAAVTTIHVNGLTDGLCGPFRPGHFDGVATIVAKLFNIVKPDAAFFGEKDFQQLRVVQRMTRDLNLDLEIVPCPTVREPDGLAMSSRNAYLSAPHRLQAAVLHRAMTAAAQGAAAGQLEAAPLIEAVTRHIHDAGPTVVEYVSIVDSMTLEPLTIIDRPARICVAVRIGACRLIDNMEIGGAATGVEPRVTRHSSSAPESGK